MNLRSSIFVLLLIALLANGHQLMAAPCNQISHESPQSLAACIGRGGSSQLLDSHHRQLMRQFSTQDMVPPQPNVNVYNPMLYSGGMMPLFALGGFYPFHGFRSDYLAWPYSQYIYSSAPYAYPYGYPFY